MPRTQKYGVPFRINGKQNPEYWKQYREVHREEINAGHRERFLQRTKQAYTILGNKCAICENDELAVLEIDHIHNDGEKQRKEVGLIVYWIIDHPEDAKTRLQLLCGNCHNRKHSRFTEGRIRSATR